MVSKRLLYLFIGLVAIIVGQQVFFRTEIRDLRDEKMDLLSDQKEAIKQIRDSATARIDTLTTNSQKRFDSILKIPAKIKYIPYEKPIYINRTLDDALDVHAKHKAEQRAAKKN